MSGVVIALVVIAAVVMIVATPRVLRRRRTDGVDSFRRQIEALSAESRRTTVDRVNDAARRHERLDRRGEPGDHEGGVRGS